MVDSRAQFFNATKMADSTSLYASNQTLKQGGNALMLIDPQFDFCNPAGALFVKGAPEDCKRTAKFITTNIEKLDEIYVSLDTHMNYHIAHPTFWYKEVSGKRVNPDPFTAISHDEVVRGVWKPVDESETMKKHVRNYTRKLEHGGLKTKLMIWPPHCLIGTSGHNVEATIMEALMKWEKATNKSVHYIIKGNNSMTEHYSAFSAEVPLMEDPATKFNEPLFRKLICHQKIYIGGQARDFCVLNTVNDLLGEMKRLGKKHLQKKVVLLENAMSDVGANPTAGKEWFEGLRKDPNLSPPMDIKVDEAKLLLK